MTIFAMIAILSRLTNSTVLPGNCRKFEAIAGCRLFQAIAGNCRFFAKLPVFFAGNFCI
jgi:hypothetical protein